MKKINLLLRMCLLLTTLVTAHQVLAQNGANSQNLSQVAKLMAIPNYISLNMGHDICEEMTSREVEVTVVDDMNCTFFTVYSESESIGCYYLIGYNDVTRKMYRLTGFENPDVDLFFSELKLYQRSSLVAKSLAADNDWLLDILLCLQNYSETKRKKRDRKISDYECLYTCGGEIVIH